MHAEERARPRTESAPRVNQMSLAIELRELLAHLVEHPDFPIRVEIDEVQIEPRCPRLHRPHADELAVLVEDLDAAVAAIVDVDLLRGDVDADSVHVVEIVRPRLEFRVRTVVCPLLRSEERRVGKYT